MFSVTWLAGDGEEPTHLSKRVANVVPGVVVCFQEKIIMKFTMQRKVLKNKDERGKCMMLLHSFRKKGV